MCFWSYHLSLLPTLPRSTSNTHPPNFVLWRLISSAKITVCVALRAWSINLSSPRQKCPISVSQASRSFPNTPEEHILEEDRLAWSISSDSYPLDEWTQVSHLDSLSSALHTSKPKITSALTHWLCWVSKSTNGWHTPQVLLRTERLLSF